MDPPPTINRIFFYNSILNKNISTYNAGNLVLTNATISPKDTDDSTNVSIVNSKAPIDLLFWGECVKTMSVNNNRVQISY